MHKALLPRNIGAWATSGSVNIISVTKYYSFGGQRIAMRQGNAVYYLHSDYLGSMSLTTISSSGSRVAESRYYLYDPAVGGHS